MSALLNDLVRGAIGWLIAPAAWASDRGVRRRIARYDADQAALRLTYGIADDTPIEVYGPALRARIEAIAAARPDVHLATTSGSTAEPKKIAFPPERVRAFTATSRAAGIRAFAWAGVRRPDMMILASLKQDASFTAMVLKERRAMPSWLGGLLDPGRFLRHPDLADLAGRYGVTATRLWLMAVVEPGLLYCTNPSTLAVLLDEVYGDWPRATALIRAYVSRDAGLPLATLDAVVRRAGSRGAEQRLARLAASGPLPVHEALPGLKGFASWDGGYVGVFLDRVRKYLPRDRFLHLPMYSMSTETMQTLPLAVDGALRFLPVAPGVLYEFLHDGAPDEPGLLLRPSDLRPGMEVTLVASDAYGLRRYQTEDVFRVEAVALGLPDLRFARRRGLAWSFTGEKLTGQHLEQATAEVRAAFPAVADGQLTTIPVRDLGGLPGYRLVLAVTSPSPLSDDADGRAAVAKAYDDALCRINDEYAQKRTSARLAAPELVVMDYERLACALDSRTLTAQDRADRAWESQFKLTPLAKQAWEDIGWGE